MEEYRDNPYIDEYDDLEDEIDIMELVSKLWNKRQFIIKCCCIAAVVGIIAGFSIHKEYNSGAQLAPESSQSSSMSNISSLAALAGVRMPSGNSSGAVSPDLYPDIISSTPFMVGLFDTPVSFMEKKEQVEMSLFEYIMTHDKKPWWNAVIRFPMTAISWTLGLLREKPEELTVEEMMSNVDPTQLTPVQNGIVGGLRDRINLAVDKKTSVISIDVKMQNPEVAKQVADKVVESLQEYVTRYRTDKAVEDLEFTQELYDEAKANYHASQQKYASYVDAHQGIVLQSARTEQERLQNEMNLDYQLYNSMAQQLQMSKAKVQEQTPIYTMLQPPLLPLRKSSPSKPKLLVVFMFLGFCGAAAWVLFGEDAVANLKKREEETEQA